MLELSGKVSTGRHHEVGYRGCRGSSIKAKYPGRGVMGKGRGAERMRGEFVDR